jgi:hypothetical protein
MESVIFSRFETFFILRFFARLEQKRVREVDSDFFNLLHMNEDKVLVSLVSLFRTLSTHTQKKSGIQEKQWL